jgi:hypothetical protein
VSYTRITVNWSAVPTATSYNVYLNGGGPYTTSSTSYGFTGLANGTTYTFTVYAANAGGTNPTGASTNATTTAATVQRWENTTVGTVYPSPPAGATKVQIYIASNGYGYFKTSYNVNYYSGPTMDFSYISISATLPGATNRQTPVQLTGSVTYSINGGGSVTVNANANTTGTAKLADYGFLQVVWSGV